MEITALELNGSNLQMKKLKLLFQNNNTYLTTLLSKHWINFDPIETLDQIVDGMVFIEPVYDAEDDKFFPF